VLLNLSSQKNEKNFLSLPMEFFSVLTMFGAGEGFEPYKTGGYEPLPYPEFLHKLNLK